MPLIRETRTNEDIAQARVLFKEYAAQLGHGLEFQHFTDELDALPGVYAPPRGQLLLLDRDGVLAGCVALRPLSDTICEMKRLFVRPEFRGRGFGRQLAVEIIAAARQIGYWHMRLDTLRSMTVPRALYNSLGFRETEPYYHNPIEGATFFELDLRSDPDCPPARSRSRL